MIYIPYPMSKLTVQLPVTPFVYCILKRSYGENIIANNRQNKQLWKDLQVQPVISVNRKKNLLTHRIEVTVSGRLAVNIRRQNLEELSMHFHGEYLARMYRYMYAQVQAQKPAYASLKDFYEMYEIGEDDFPIDSAYRGWLRFQAKQRDNSDFFPQSVREENSFDVSLFILQFKTKIGGRFVRLSVIDEHFDKHFFTSSKRYPLNISTSHLLRVRCYLYHTLANKSLRSISKRVNRSHMTVKYHLGKVEKTIAIESELRNCLQNLLEDLEGKPLQVLVYRHSL